MLARRFTSFFKKSPSSKLSSTGNSVNEESGKSFGRKALSFVLVTVTGGVALSALDDLAIYHGCTRSEFCRHGFVDREAMVTNMGSDLSSINRLRAKHRLDRDLLIPNPGLFLTRETKEGCRESEVTQKMKELGLER